jgi:hypothetical protein
MFRSRRSTAILVTSLAVAAVGCTEATSPGDAAAQVYPLGSLSIDLAPIAGFVACTARPAQVDTFSVGARGGTFRVDYARVVIPRGALADGVVRTFEMRTPSAAFNSVILTPIDGGGVIAFGAPVRVVVGYQNCERSHVGRSRLAAISDADGLPAVVSALPSADDATASEVSGDAMLLSRYAVSY